MCISSVTALDVVSVVPGIEVGRAELLHQDALHGLSELVKTDSVDITPADALITYFEKHLTAACHRTWIRPGRAVSPGKRYTSGCTAGDSGRLVGLVFTGGAHTLLLVINNLTEEAARARLA